VVQENPKGNGNPESVEAVEPYEKYASIFHHWPLSQAALTSTQWGQIMCGTTERLYGKFEG
jgi:hypothetical protein